MKNELRYGKLSSEAIIPQRTNNDATGFSLFAVEDCSISPGCRSLVNTHTQLMTSYYNITRIVGRNDMCRDSGIITGGGEIGSHHRGEIKVILFNLGQYMFHIKKGDPIAQIIVEMKCLCEFNEIDTLPPTDRTPCL